MAEFLTLRGRNALSPFRVKNLLAHLAGTRITGLAAEFWHFVEIARPLSAPERATLDRLLTYGPQGDAHTDSGELLLVIPRPGTISPWASKATDIAHSCGARRDRAHRARSRLPGLDNDGAAPMRCRAALALLPRIHDRMTEAVYPTLDDARRLFTHVAPQPMSMIDLLGRWSRRHWSAANAALGLALSDDEIDYLAENFRARRPQSDRRRTDDVRAGEFRALPAQDLQCGLDRRRRAPTAVAVRHDPAHARRQSAAHRRRLRRQRRHHGRRQRRGVSIPMPTVCIRRTTRRRTS